MGRFSSSVTVSIRRLYLSKSSKTSLSLAFGGRLSRGSIFSSAMRCSGAASSSLATETVPENCARLSTNDGVQLVQVNLLLPHPLQYFVTRRSLAHENELRVHHAASRGRIEFQQFADLIGFLARHLVQKFLGRFLGQIAQEVGCRIGGHLFQNVRGLLRVQFFHDLRGQPLVQLREDRRRGLLIQRG